MELYFVRHAESEGNAKGYLSTVDHDQLSPLGLKQAERLAERLTDIEFDHIYVSCCRRTLQTIAPYLRMKKRKGEVWSELAEACWQQEVDKPVPERKGTPDPVVIPEDLKESFTVAEDSPSAPWGDEWGEETFKEGAIRVAASRDKILRRHAFSNDRILVVGHFNSGTRLLELFLGLSHSQRFTHDNTGLTCLSEKDDGSFKIEFVNRI